MQFMLNPLPSSLAFGKTLGVLEELVPFLNKGLAKRHDSPELKVPGYYGRFGIRALKAENADISREVEQIRAEDSRDENFGAIMPWNVPNDTSYL